MATKKPSCGLMKIRSQSCPRSASTWQSGSVRKLKIGVATVKQITMPTMKATTEWISRCAQLGQMLDQRRRAVVDLVFRGHDLPSGSSGPQRGLVFVGLGQRLGGFAGLALGRGARGGGLDLLGLLGALGDQLAGLALGIELGRIEAAGQVARGVLDPVQGAAHRVGGALQPLGDVLDPGLVGGVVHRAAEFARHALGLADEVPDIAEQDRQILGADHDQRHDADEQKLGPAQVEHGRYTLSLSVSWRA